MGVGAARAERADAGPARQAGCGSLPVRKRVVDPETAPLEIDLTVGWIAVQARRQLAMTHLQQHLGQRRDPGRRFQMPDVGFQRPYRAGLGAWSESLSQS